MAEYIEREAVVHHFMTKRQYLTKDLVMDAAYEVSKFPAADVAPVVRCKRCRHAKWSEKNKAYYCQRRWAMHKVRERDFCSYGERKDGDCDV